MALSPVGALLIAALLLAVEVGLKGYPHSSFAAFGAKSPSANVDAFYMFLYASNLKNSLGLMISFGIGHLIHHWIVVHCSLGILANANFFVSLAALAIVNTFLFYWVHRIMHSPLFWPVHKVHHSATEMNLITNFRNHPVNITIEVVLYATSTAVLGGSFAVSISYYILNGIYQLLAHSNFSWDLRHTHFAFIQNWLLLAPEEHRLHHSQAEPHWHKNFGVVPIWDRIFGTWQECEQNEALILACLICETKPCWPHFRVYGK